MWTDDCENSFQELTAYLGKALILSKPNNGEILSLYLVVYVILKNFRTLKL